MKGLWKYVVVFLFIILIAVQFVPVSRSNPPVTSEIQTPENIKTILKTSCYDCHSNETSWPWYSRVAPMSWLVVNDVNEAREEMNFSTWGEYSQKKISKKLEEIWEEVDKGNMPLWQYVILHPESRLTDQDKIEIHNWVSVSLPPGSLDTDKQFHEND